MAFNPSAFGPLSAGTKQAAGLLSGGTSGGAGGGLSLRRLSGRPSFGEPQETPAVESPVGLATGAQAPIEEQQPLLPEGEATGERGDITQLPGFQAAASEGGLAELPSTDELTGADQQQASAFRNQLQRLMDQGGPDQSTLDATKALKATSSTLKLNSSLQRLAKDFGLLGSSSLTLAPSTVAGLGPSAAATGFAPLTAKGLGEATAGAASGGTSGLGTATAGAGALAALLGLLATATDNKDLGTAAKAAGVGTGLLGLANTGTSLASLAPLLGTTTAAVPIGAAAGLGGGAATGLAAGGTAGLGTAAGAAAAPIALMLLGSTISGLVGGEDPFGEGIGEILDPLMGDYHRFIPDLMANQAQQGIGFSTLGQALPYVESKEELGQLLNSYKNYVGTTAGLTLEDRSGTGDPYRLTAMPGTGPVTHGEQTPAIDWGPQEQGLQRIVDALLTALPGERITAAYGQPGGGLTGEPARRLWEQFPSIRLGAGDRNIPNIFAAQDAATGLPTRTLPVYAGADQPYGAVSPLDFANAMNAGTMAERPSWDPATGQWVHTPAGMAPPAPSDYFQPSATWQALAGGGATQSPAAPASAGPTDLLDLQRLVAAARPQAGALAPDLPSEFSEAARNPAALQSLLAQPGLLARLFAPQGVA